MKALVFAVWVVLASQAAWAQDAAPTLRLTLKPKQTIKTGQLLVADFSIELPASVSVAIPKSDFGALELHHKKHRELRKGEQIEHHFEFALQALKPGPVTIPELTVQLIDAKGEISSVTSKAQSLRVASWLGNEPNAKLKGTSKDDATVPEKVWQDDLRLLFAWLIALALLLIVAVVWLVVKKWQAYAAGHTPLPAPRPAWEIAEAKLSALRNERASLFEQGKGEEFIDRLSDILREYLGLRYGFDGLECTSDEVISHLKTLRPEGISIEALSLRFSDYDLIKFAKADAQEQKADAFIDETRALIQQSKAHLTQAEATEATHG